MQERVRKFLEVLNKRVPELQKESESMAALLIMNMFVDQGIPLSSVMRALEQMGLPWDPIQLAGFREMSKELLIQSTLDVMEQQKQSQDSDQPDDIIVVTVGGETFELFSSTQSRYVSGLAILSYGEKHKADMDQKTAEHFSKHWSDLPRSVRLNYYIAFPKTFVDGTAMYLFDVDGMAYKYCGRLAYDYWPGSCLLARRLAKLLSA